MAPLDSTPPKPKRERRPRWQAPTKPRLLPVKRWAAQAGIPYSSARAIVHRGEIAIVRIGRAQYLEQADGDRWIAMHKETA